MFSFFLLAKGAFQTNSLRLVKPLYIVMRVVVIICLPCLAAFHFSFVFMNSINEGNFVLRFLNPIVTFLNRLNHV